MTKVGEIDLPSGRRLYLRSLRQYQTYEGLLEGLPTMEMNGGPARCGERLANWWAEWERIDERGR